MTAALSLATKPYFACQFLSKPVISGWGGLGWACCRMSGLRLGLLFGRGL